MENCSKIEQGRGEQQFNLTDYYWKKGGGDTVDYIDYFCAQLKTYAYLFLLSIFKKIYIFEYL